jgi:hypothetical protein
MTVFTHPMATPACLQMRPMPKIEQSRDTWGDLKYDISSLTAVTPIRAATGDEFFPAEGDATGTAVPGLYMHCDFIDKSHILSLFSLDCLISSGLIPHSLLLQ